MAMRIHLGMIGDDVWDRLVDAVFREYPSFGYFNTWMKQHYNAIEVTGLYYTQEAGDKRVYEFADHEKYVEFCLRWL